MKTKLLMVILVALGVFAPPALGEPEIAPPKDDVKAAPHEGPHGVPGTFADEDIREMVSTILMVRVSRSLELTDEQTVILVKHMQEMRDALSQLYSQRDATMKSLRELVDKDGATDDEINAKLQELISNEDKRVQAKRDAFDTLSSGLTAKQKAKLFVTLQDFEGQMRKMMARAKEMGEDAVRERFQNWQRGEGPPHGPMDRPMVREFMKKRRPDGTPEKSEMPAAPDDEKKAEGPSAK